MKLLSVMIILSLLISCGDDDKDKDKDQEAYSETIPLIPPIVRYEPSVDTQEPP